jgi:hypothetical protein
MCESYNKSELFSPSWHMLLTHMYLWTNHLCISHLTQLIHLGCHSITKTKQGPFTRAGGSSYGGGELVAWVWGERRGRRRKDKEEREALEREEGGEG